MKLNFVVFNILDISNNHLLWLYQNLTDYCYSVRSSNLLNNSQIYSNGTLIDTITTTPTIWELYSDFVYPTIGTNTILFEGQDDSNYKDSFN